MTVPVTRASHRTLVVYVGALLLAVGRAIDTNRADATLAVAVALLAWPT